MVQDLKPQVFTILGRNVDDIASTIKSPNKKDIVYEKYGFPEHDNFGVWISQAVQKLRGSKNLTVIFFR